MWRKSRSRIVSGLLLGVLVLTGCALFPADRLSVETGQFFVAYRQASVAYAGLAARMRHGCQTKTLSAETCQDVAAIDTEMRRLSGEIDRAILKGERSVDWERLNEMLGTVIRLAFKVL